MMQRKKRQGTKKEDEQSKEQIKEKYKTYMEGMMVQNKE